MFRVLNIFLDALFMAGFGWGVKGAAAATVLAHIISVSYLVYFMFCRAKQFPVKWPYFKPDFSVLKEIFGVGIAAFFRQTAMSLVTVVINRRLVVYGGSTAIAVYGIVFRMFMMLFTPLMGLTMGFQPIAGFNYGARRFDRLKQVMRAAMIAASVISTTGALILFIFPMPMLRFFSDDPQLLDLGFRTIRVIILAFPLVGFQIIGSTMFQALGRKVPNLILSLSRQILFLIPMVIILPRYFSLIGIWAAFPVSDILSFLLTLIFVFRLNRDLNSEIINQEKDHV